MKVLLRKLEKIQKASHELRILPSAVKDRVLIRISEVLKARQEEILKANRQDLKVLSHKGSPAFRDRLTLTSERLQTMVDSLKAVAQLPDPLGELPQLRTLENGLVLKKVRAPLGVIYMIFESRPNVAVESFSLAFKAGNAVILRGGKEALHTTKILYDMISKALKDEGAPIDALLGVTDPDRKISQFLLEQKKFIDVVVPRGGDRLIEFVTRFSKIPIIKNNRGLCHTYVDSQAKLEMAVEIVINAKTQRPGVCNAMETLLVHSDVAAEFLSQVWPRLEEKGVKGYVDQASRKILGKRKSINLAKDKNWDTEYLDLVLNCRVVPSLDAALEHIQNHGSRHSEAIVTEDESAARRFQNEVDAAAVYWNASTRFTDGFEFGLGGELGISTQKLHVRGPVGLKELTSSRWIIDGQGQIRK